MAQIGRTEGMSSLYRGFGPALLGCVPGVCLYFGSYHWSKSRFEQSLGANSHMVNFAAGFFAEAVSCLVWVPTDVLKERSQAASVGTKPSGSSYSVMRTIIADEGFRGVYRGYGATLASFGPFSAFYFMFVEQMKASLKLATKQEELSFPQLVTTCALAGGAAALCTAPMDLVKVRMQVERRSAGGKLHYPNILSGLTNVFKREGFRGLFRGGSSRVWFAVPNTAITMSIMESIKHRLDHN